MSAPRLREVQALFFRSIAKSPGRDRVAPALAAMVDDGGKVDRFERIAVYEHAYFLRLRDVLSEDFPRTASLLGSEAFDRLVNGYLHEYPSAHPSVRYLGRFLAHFIEAQAIMPLWLADLVRLEWERIEMFDAPDSGVAGLDLFIGTPPDEWPEICCPISALRVLQLAWPVHRLWAGGEAASIISRPTILRVWRAPDYSVRHASIDRREASALAHLMNGEPFGAVCEVFSDLSESEAAQRAGALLARWMADGLVAVNRDGADPRSTLRRCAGYDA